MDLQRFDQNLWLVLDALFKERSVSGAAQRLHLSQSALSHALKRLRSVFDDPLFIRQSGQMIPTAKAKMLQQPMQQALQMLQAVTHTVEQFNPNTAKRHFVIAVTDFTAEVFLPGLLQKVKAVSNDITFKIVPISHELPEKLLESGKLDLALSFSHGEKITTPLHHQRLISGDYKVISRKNHPLIGNQLTLENFLAAPHILTSPWGDEYGSLDKVLKKQGLTRHIELIQPHLFMTPKLVAHSDLIATVPERMLTPEHSNTLAVYDPPIALPCYQLLVYWHPVYQGDHGLLWLRELLNSLDQVLEQTLRH